MITSKENHHNSLKSNFIRYLYQEGVRKGVNTNPEFYKSILNFVETDEGVEALRKFIKTNIIKTEEESSIWSSKKNIVHDHKSTTN